MRLKSSKIFNIFLAVSLILFPYENIYSMQSSNYIIDKDSINFGGTDESESANYKLSDTMGEIGTGESSAKCSSLGFDGNGDYVDMGNASIFIPGTSETSYCVWVKAPDVEQNAMIFSKRETSSSYSQVSIVFADDLHGGTGVSKKIVAFNRVDGNNDLNVKSNQDVADGTWHHICFLRSNTYSRLYIDGQLDNELVDNNANIDVNNNYPLLLGSVDLNGILDDFRVYNRALSTTEISNLYNGKQIDNTGLKGYWDLNEGSGATTADLSGNGNDGTIYNATFSTDTPSVTCNIMNAGYRQDDSSASTISISSPDNVILGPSIGGILGGSGTGSAAWTVITSNLAGYQVSIKSTTTPALVFSSYSFADYIPGAGIPDYDWTMTSSASEFGYSVEGAHTVSKFLDNGSICAAGNGNVSDKCWLGFSMSDESVATSALPNNPAGTATTIKFRAEAGSQRMQQDGTYVATIVVTAVAL